MISIEKREQLQSILDNLADQEACYRDFLNVWNSGISARFQREHFRSHLDFHHPATGLFNRRLDWEDCICSEFGGDYLNMTPWENFVKAAKRIKDSYFYINGYVPDGREVGALLYRKLTTDVQKEIDKKSNMDELNEISELLGNAKILNGSAFHDMWSGVDYWVDLGLDDDLEPVYGIIQVKKNVQTVLTRTEDCYVFQKQTYARMAKHHEFLFYEYPTKKFYDIHGAEIKVMF